MGTPKEDGIVLELGGLKALAHPLRVQILDALSGYGPSTASALAEKLGESSGATSYHLRQLEKHGFIREDTTRGSGRERWWERVPRPITLNASGFAPDSAERAASELVVGEWQRSRQQRLQQYTQHAIERLPKEWIEAGTISTSNVQLTVEQTAELVRRMEEVLDGYLDQFRNQRVAGARPVQIHMDVFALIDGVEQAGDVGGSEEA